MEPNLTSQIISGCMDSNCTIMAVHLESLMHMAKLLKSKELEESIKGFLNRCSDAVDFVDFAEAKSQTAPEQESADLLKILSQAIDKTHAKIEVGSVINMANANSLRLLKPKFRLNQLNLVLLWAPTIKSGGCNPFAAITNINVKREK